MLMRAIVQTEKQAKATHAAFAAVGLSTEKGLDGCAAVLCEHACRILKADEACVYVGVRTVLAGGMSGAEQLFQLRTAEPTPEEVEACEYDVHGAPARLVPTDGLAGACLGSRNPVLRAAKGCEEMRYEEDSDRVPGKPPPGSLLYLNLSDPGGPLRAVLRVARNGGAAQESFDGFNERSLLELLPIFALGLRFPCRDADRDANPSATRRATAAAMLSECLGSLPDVCAAAGLGGICHAFSSRIAELLEADGCVLFVHEEEGQQLLALPPSHEEEAVEVDLVVEGGSAPPVGATSHPSGLSALAACNREVYAVEGEKDGRLNQVVDRVPGSADETRTALAVPFESLSSGALLGVCTVVNKRRGRGGSVFTEDDQALLLTLLRPISLAIENMLIRMEIEDTESHQRKERIAGEMSRRRAEAA